MTEIEEWFYRELGPLGFSLTPIIINPTDFTPRRGIIYSYARGYNVKLNTTITPELARDIRGWGISRAMPDPIEEMRGMVISEIKRELEEYNLPSPWVKDFTPKKRIPKFKL